MTDYPASLPPAGNRKKKPEHSNGRGEQHRSHGRHRQRPQQQQWEQQPRGEEASEQSPLLSLQPRLLDPSGAVPPSPTYTVDRDNQVHEKSFFLGPFHGGNGNSSGHHNRTRSVDATSPVAQPPPPPGTIPSPPRRNAPGRDHHRTRSLEEWAHLFGIPGVAGGNVVVAKTRERELYRSPARSSPASSSRKTSSSSKPPRIPKGPPSAAASHYSPSTPRKHVRTLTLDRIAEAVELPDEKIDSGDHGKESIRRRSAVDRGTNDVARPTTPADDQKAAFAAAATAEHRTSHDSINYQTQRSSFTDNDNQSVGSNGSSVRFAVPQYLTNSGRYSSGGYSSSVNGDGADNDDGEHDDYHDDNSSAGGGSWIDTFSRSSHGTPSRSDSFDYAASERLLKFEQEQEKMFEQKKKGMERELTNVLERSAVKSHREKQEFISTYISELEKERAKLVAQWKQEWEKDEEFLRQRDPKRKLFRDLHDKVGRLLDICMFCFSSAEVFISNMPLTIAALALSWVSMGCCWFKFTEENIDSCNHVHFYSPDCTFPEFPGCFVCDEENDWYRLAVSWHYLCSSVSFVFCSMIMLKVIIAWDVVVDELGNPSTSTPCGVFCIAMVCVFAGRGPVGEMVVLITATFHFVLAFWFLYMAIYKYRLFPDPGWFPNTVGISYAAVKSFLYLPMFGEVLMTLCLTFFFGVFFISGIRVATNPKIAAPICWFMISAPSITLYAVTLISQPMAEEEELMSSNPQMKTHFINVLHQYYLPLHHFLFGCSLLGVFSAIQGVSTRWKKFREKEFSPAHVAFVAPTLAHTNAIQSYRATLMSLSRFPTGGWFLTSVYIYWCFCLFTGTIVCFIFTYKFLRRLPQWTKLDVADEEAPPEPYETMTHEMLDDRGAREAMFHQTFVNPAVLEANEAGALVRVRRGTEDYRRYGPYIRTRKVTARGFDPSMNDAELREERAALLDWVAKNAPRKRNRTMSIPGVMHLRDKSGRDVYGTFLGGLASDDSYDSSEAGERSRAPPGKHARSKTSVDGYW